MASPASESLRIAVGQTGGGLLLAALTTMVSFLAFRAASQPFLHDLGLLAAVSMGLSCLLSVTFLPALLVSLPPPQRLRPPRALGLPTLITAICTFPPPHPRPVAAAVSGRPGSAALLATPL